jgi:hypothetical protein
VIAQAVEIFEKGGSSWLCTGRENWACSVLIILLLSRRASPFFCAKRRVAQELVLGGLTCRFSPPTPASSTAPLSLQRPDRAPCSASSPSTDQHFALLPAAGHCCNCCNYCNCCNRCRLPAAAAAAAATTTTTTPALLLRTKEIALSALLLLPCSLKYSPRHGHAIGPSSVSWGPSVLLLPSPAADHRIKSLVASLPDPIQPLVFRAASLRTPITRAPPTATYQPAITSSCTTIEARGCTSGPRQAATLAPSTPKRPSPLLLLAARVRQSPTSERKSKELSPP